MVKPSVEIAREQSRLITFRDAFVRVLSAQDGVTDEMFDEVSLAAGSARRAYRLNDGKTFAVQDGIYLIPNADPMSQWQAVFDSDSDLSAAKVLSAVNLAIGRAEERLMTAREHERGLVGMISAVLRWPVTLRNAVGDGRPQQRAAFSVGIAGQILVLVVSAWIIALGTQFAGWAWNVVAGLF